MKFKYFYPALSDKDYGWFRISGPGLANCMFFAVNAYISSKKTKESISLQHGESLV